MHSEILGFDPSEVVFAAVVGCVESQLEQVRNLAVFSNSVVVASHLAA